MFDYKIFHPNPIELVTLLVVEGVLLPVLMLCISQLIIQVLLLLSTMHFLRWPSTISSMVKLMSRPLPRTKARNIPWPR